MSEIWPDYIFGLTNRIMESASSRSHTIIGIDGPGASGKSFLAERLARGLRNCAVIHFDDFFLPQTEDAEDEYGYRFDWHRLEHEVLIPARKGDSILYRKLDWNTNRLSQEITLTPSEFLIVEGVYSLREELWGYYDFRILVTAPYTVRLNRGVERDGETMKSTWVDTWMPEELRYFASSIGPAESAVDAIVDGTTKG
jgi:uridine kinase